MKLRRTKNNFQEIVSMEIFRSKNGKYLIEWSCSFYSSESRGPRSSLDLLEIGKDGMPELFLTLEPRKIAEGRPARPAPGVSSSLLRGALVALGERPEDHGLRRVIEIPEDLWWSNFEYLGVGTHEFPWGITAEISFDEEHGFFAQLFMDGHFLAGMAEMMPESIIGDELRKRAYPICYVQEGLLEAWKLEHEMQGESLFPKEEAGLFRAMGVPLPIFWEPKEAFAWLSEYVSGNGQ